MAGVKTDNRCLTSSSDGNAVNGPKSEEDHRDDTGSKNSFLTIRGTPIYFHEDWAVGIGGGLWSTGLALARYLQTDHASQQLERLYERRRQKRLQDYYRHPYHFQKNHDDKLTILELGSGNGFLAVCWLALAQQFVSDFVVSDTADHLSMIQRTLEANRHCWEHHDVRVHVVEHSWGVFPRAEETSKNCTMQKPLPRLVTEGSHKFDLIVGSDLAYRKELYDPLIASLLQFSHDDTITLLGVTMTDTTPSFFHKLRGAGFTYCKFADHLLEPEFRGTTFGIFAIRKRKKTKYT